MHFKPLKYFFSIISSFILFSCSSYSTKSVEFSKASEKNELHIKKVNNFRSIGSIKNKDGRILKDSIFYRSGDLHQLKESKKITELKINNIIDLRTNNEVFKKHDVLIPNITIHYYPAFDDKEDQMNQAKKLVLKGKVNVNDANDRMIKFYKEYPTENTQVIKAIITELLDSDSPILFHCTAGKDRTGIIGAIIMKILKFDDQTIFQEYLLSNNLRKKIILKRLNKAKNLHFLFPKMDLGVLEKLSWVESSYLKASFDEINSKYGSIDNYINTILEISEDKRKDYIEKYTY